MTLLTEYDTVYYMSLKDITKGMARVGKYDTWHLPRKRCGKLTVMTAGAGHRINRIRGKEIVQDEIEENEKLKNCPNCDMEI